MERINPCLFYLLLVLLVVVAQTIKSDNDNPQANTITQTTPTAALPFEPQLTGKLQQRFIQHYAGIYKEIPRVTYFTCQAPAWNDDEEHEQDRKQEDDVEQQAKLQKLARLHYAKNLALLRGFNTALATATDAVEQRDVFVNFVHTDALDNSQTKSINGGRGKMRDGIANGRQTDADWLDDVLTYEALRHIAAVDLACGIKSRRLLELASSRMLFNAKIHWLLIEDYALHNESGFGIPDSDSNKSEGKQALEDNVDEGSYDKLVSIESFMSNLSLYVNTELTLVKRNLLDAKGSYQLYDVWNPGLQYGGDLNITEIGNYTYSSGLQLCHWYRKTSTLLRRMNMHEARIRVMNVVANKNMTGTLEHYLTTPYDVHIDSMNRFNYNLLLGVRDMFNMSFTLQRTSSWGYLKNGKFDGMISALIKKQTDLAGSPIFYRLERHKFVDAAARTWTSRPCFIFRHPSSTKKDRIVFLQPFSNDVWIVLAICGIFTVLLLWLLTTIELNLIPNAGASLIKAKGGAAAVLHQQQVAHAEVLAKQRRESRALSTVEEKDNVVEVLPQLIITGNPLQRCLIRSRNLLRRQRQRAGESRKRAGLFLESVLFYVGIICQQGLGFSTSFFSGRCIVITSLLFSFCIYQFYSASIVGTLLMEKPKTIRTLSDLVHSSLQVGVEDILYNRDYFLRTKDPVAIELYAKKIISMPDNGENEPEENQAEGTDAEELTDDEKAKLNREILHSHESGAHAKTNDASNWLDPESGMQRVKKGRFAFHTDVATAYKIIAETFNEREICDLTEISLFPPQKTVSVMQKDSPLRKVVAYGLRRVIEAGIMSYQIKIWHSRKPPCVKQLETSDLHVDMETVSSALLVLIFGFGLALLILYFEILHFRFRQRAIRTKVTNTL